MKEYTLHDWRGPQLPEPVILRKQIRARERGPVMEEMVQRDGAWPEFIPFVPKPQGVDLEAKKARAEARAAQVQTPEQRRAKALAYYHANKDKLLPGMRARAKAYYHKGMTPEQKAKRAARHKAFLKAHPEKRREYNARYIKKHPEKKYIKHPRAGHGPDGRFLKKQQQQ